MSDGPLPNSTRGVDSSPEAIVAMVLRCSGQLSRAVRRALEDTAEAEFAAGDRAVADGLQFLLLHWNDRADAAALLAQVARERDEARTLREQMRVDRFHECESVRAEAKAAIEAAERQLAEARAALEPLEEGYRNRCNYCHGETRYCDPRPECPAPKARALLSGETT